MSTCLFEALIKSMYHELRTPVTSRCDLAVKREVRFFVDFNFHEAKNVPGKLLDQFWFVGSALLVQLKYNLAISLMLSGDFYDAWCLLDEIDLHCIDLKTNPVYPLGNGFIKRNHSLDDFWIGHIHKHVRQFQSIYPYEFFTSPEWIHKNVVCSICKEYVSPRKPCGHNIGYLYRGIICRHIPSNTELVGTSLVTHPVQKYSVLFPTDDDGSEWDPFDYTPVKSIANALRDRFSVWGYTTREVRHPVDVYKSINVNSPCPCNSGKKFKKCCLPTGEVKAKHIEFHGDLCGPRNMQFPTVRDSKRLKLGSTFTSVIATATDHSHDHDYVDLLLAALPQWSPSFDLPQISPHSIPDQSPVA